MNFDQYCKAVVSRAKELYEGAICIDNVRMFYDDGGSIEEAAQDAAFTSHVYDHGFV